MNLQLLQVAIRGLSRFGDSRDLALFGEIRNRKKDFMALRKEPEYRELVKRVMRWIGE